MRAGISITVSSADDRRLTALIEDRNTPQKHVWRAQIVLLSGDGLGTNAIMRCFGIINPLLAFDYCKCGPQLPDDMPRSSRSR